MCWEMDYHWFAEQQKAQEKEREKQKQAQRADAIDKLLTEANPAPTPAASDGVAMPP